MSIHGETQWVGFPNIDGLVMGDVRSARLIVLCAASPMRGPGLGITVSDWATRLSGTDVPPTAVIGLSATDPETGDDDVVAMARRIMAENMGASTILYGAGAFDDWRAVLDRLSTSEGPDVDGFMAGEVDGSSLDDILRRAAERRKSRLEQAAGARTADAVRDVLTMPHGQRLGRDDYLRTLGTAGRHPVEWPIAGACRVDPGSIPQGVLACTRPYVPAQLLSSPAVVVHVDQRCPTDKPDVPSEAMATLIAATNDGISVEAAVAALEPLTRTPANLVFSAGTHRGVDTILELDAAIARREEELPPFLRRRYPNIRAQSLSDVADERFRTARFSPHIQPVVRAAPAPRTAADAAPSSGAPTSKRLTK